MNSPSKKGKQVEKNDPSICRSSLIRQRNQRDQIQNALNVLPHSNRLILTENNSTNLMFERAEERKRC